MADALAPAPGVGADTATSALADAVGLSDSSRADPPSVEVVPDRARRIQRLLEIVPGVITWGLIVTSVGLSFRWPEFVAWFVLSFDVYWLYRAVMLTGGVVAAYTMLRKTVDQDWRTRTYALRDVSGRIAQIEERLPRMAARVAALTRDEERPAALGGRRDMARLRSERKDLLRLLARRGDAIPDPDRLWHVALVPTHTEPYEKLHATVMALADADWPTERLMVAIITRETDLQGRENVARLREVLGHRFLHFFHILDPLEPGIVVGKSSAMAYGGRWLYRKLESLGFDPGEVLVTDLDSDYRVHSGYFGYLRWTFLTDTDRYRRLYQPIPMFHNNMWETALPIRLVAIGATHVHMGRSLTPEKLVSFSSYSVSLRTIHEVDYWATDAIPEDSRFYWKSFFRFSGEFRAIPLFMPIYGDAVRARSYPRSLIEQYTQIRRWAWGVTDIPYYIRNAFAHSEIPRMTRIGRLLELWFDHLNWAIAPFVIIFGSNLPLILNPAFAQTTLGQNLPLYASWLLTGAFACLVVLMYVEERIAPPRPASWGLIRNVMSRVQWLLLPVVGLIFSNLPALDAQTRLMAGKYLEYKVTEKV